MIAGGYGLTPGIVVVGVLGGVGLGLALLYSLKKLIKALEDIDIQVPPRPEDSKRWKCTAKCQVVNIKTQNVEYIQGPAAIGGSQHEACRSAKEGANALIPKGYYKRHCSCDCWQ